MSSSKDTSKWIQLSSLPKECPIDVINVINVNPNRFIVICQKSNVSSGYDLKSYKYNVETDTFNTFVESNIESIVRPRPHHINITFNGKDQILFHVPLNNQIDSIQILTQEKKSYNYEQQFSYGNYFLSINNYIHIINSHNCHWIGSIENNKLISHNTINNVNEPTRRHSGAAIYIPSKQCILLIGGYYDDDGGPLTNEIWKYCLLSQKWTQININGEFRRYDFSAVLTSNQRYIILFAGDRYDEEDGDDYATDNIFVLDMKDDNNWKIKQSKIKCPDIGDCFAVRTGGVDSGHEILVIGFVKKCFKMKEFKHLSIPPFYILSIISKYFSDEMLHHIQNDKHYAIYLKQILSSLSD